MRDAKVNDCLEWWYGGWQLFDFIENVDVVHETFSNCFGRKWQVSDKFIHVTPHDVVPTRCHFSEMVWG